MQSCQRFLTIPVSIPQYHKGLSDNIVYTKPWLDWQVFFFFPTCTWLSQRQESCTEGTMLTHKWKLWSTYLKPCSKWTQNYNLVPFKAKSMDSVTLHFTCTHKHTSQFTRSRENGCCLCHQQWDSHDTYWKVTHKNCYLQNRTNKFFHVCGQLELFHFVGPAWTLYNLLCLLMPFRAED